jgi:hypothetical protein
MLRRYGQDTSRPAITLRNSKPKTPRYISSSKLDSQPDVWSDDFLPESPPPLPVTGFEDPFPGVSIIPEEFKIGPLSKSRSSKSLKSSKKTTRATITDIPAPALEFLKTRNSSTSTIFQDPQNPITIVLTAPEDELPKDPFLDETSTTNASRTRSLSVSSLPVLPSQQPNPHLLMPPLDAQHDPRTLRKAQDLREIRKWLISFLNAKGDTFPRKLRKRMMEIYAIKPSDIDPSILRKWELENEDEGVSLSTSLDGKDAEIDQKESLRILGQAMRSRIEEITPLPSKLKPKAQVKEKEKPKSPPRARPQSRKSSANANAQPLATILDDEEFEACVFGAGFAWEEDLATRPREPSSTDSVRECDVESQWQCGGDGEVEGPGETESEKYSRRRVWVGERGVWRQAEKRSG